MAHRHVKLRLNSSSVAALKSTVDAVAKQAAQQDVCRRYAEAIKARAEQYYSAAWVDDIFVGGSRHNADVEVTIEPTVTGYRVIARGDDAVWVEFGAGVFYNGEAGQSPHPSGAELGMLIGEYGNGYGKRSAWGFYNDDGELVLTHGTEAQMPLYRAFAEIVREGI